MLAFVIPPLLLHVGMYGSEGWNYERWQRWRAWSPAVVPCAWLVAGVVRRLSLEEEGVEAGSRPSQSSYGKAGDAMKESGR